MNCGALGGFFAGLVCGALTGFWRVSSAMHLEVFGESHLRCT